MRPAAAGEHLRNSPALAAAVQRDTTTEATADGKVQREIDRRLSAELYRVGLGLTAEVGPPLHNG